MEAMQKLNSFFDVVNYSPMPSSISKCMVCTVQSLEPSVAQILCSKQCIVVPQDKIYNLLTCSISIFLQASVKIILNQTSYQIVNKQTWLTVS